MSEVVAPKMTYRQVEVLSLLQEGMTNKAIGQRLGLSEKTVKAHVTGVLKFLGVTNRTSAVMSVTMVWNPVEKKLPLLNEAQKHPNSFGVQVLIHPPVVVHGSSPEHVGFYGCRYSDEPRFYLHGRIIDVTHWMPLPEPPK